MYRRIKIIAVFVMLVLLAQGCAREADVKTDAPETTAQPEAVETAAVGGIAPIRAAESGIGVLLSDLGAEITDVQRKWQEEDERNPFRHVTPDETGKVMIIMFHSFIEVYEEGDDKTVTTTIAEFRKLLERLYEDGYRTASLSDFINGSISVPRGCKPIIFTFDDGRRSQFSFIENEDGTIVENPNTGVAVMEQFYKEHPDFGLNGTFFLNLGFPGTFGTVGTLKQRLEAMAEKGFELESHTYTHANLALLNAEQIMEEMGRNSKTLNELLPGREMTILALPYGNSNKELMDYIISGSYEGFDYENIGIMLVGAEPAAQMYLNTSDPIRIRRILASGIEPVVTDFGWWYEQKGKHEFISDGNPNIISVPADKLDLVDIERVNALGKEIVVIEDAEDTEDTDA